MMKRLTFMTRLFTCLSVAFLLNACEEDDFEDTYGSGSPSTENIISRSKYLYEYNEKGLVSKIVYVDDQQTDSVVLVDVATISYPQSDRAVMVYTEDNFLTTYTFAFGENHFANRVLETDKSGETYLTKFTYDKEGHVTSIDTQDEILRMKWTNGNLTQIEQDEDHAKVVFTYGSETDFYRYNMSPFLLDVNFSSNMPTLNWWYERGLGYALYIGFLGKPCKNLPASMTASDDYTFETYPETFVYDYNDYTGHGMWYVE